MTWNNSATNYDEHLENMKHELDRYQGELGNIESILKKIVPDLEINNLSDIKKIMSGEKNSSIDIVMKPYTKFVSIDMYKDTLDLYNNILDKKRYLYGFRYKDSEYFKIFFKYDLDNNTYKEFPNIYKRNNSFTYYNNDKYLYMIETHNIYSNINNKPNEHLNKIWYLKFNKITETVESKYFNINTDNYEPYYFYHHNNYIFSFNFIFNIETETMININNKFGKINTIQKIYNNKYPNRVYFIENHNYLKSFDLDTQNIEILISFDNKLDKDYLNYNLFTLDGEEFIATIDKYPNIFNKNGYDDSIDKRYIHNNYIQLSPYYSKKLSIYYINNKRYVNTPAREYNGNKYFLIPTINGGFNDSNYSTDPINWNRYNRPCIIFNIDENNIYINRYKYNKITKSKTMIYNSKSTYEYLLEYDKYYTTIKHGEGSHPYSNQIFLITFLF